MQVPSVGMEWLEAAGVYRWVGLPSGPAGVDRLEVEGITFFFDAVDGHLVEAVLETKGGDRDVVPLATQNLWWRVTGLRVEVSRFRGLPSHLAGPVQLSPGHRPDLRAVEQVDESPTDVAPTEEGHCARLARLLGPGRTPWCELEAAVLADGLGLYGLATALERRAADLVLALDDDLVERFRERGVAGPLARVLQMVGEGDHWDDVAADPLLVQRRVTPHVPEWFGVGASAWGETEIAVYCLDHRVPCLLTGLSWTSVELDGPPLVRLEVTVPAAEARRPVIARAVTRGGEVVGTAELEASVRAGDGLATLRAAVPVPRESLIEARGPRNVPLGVVAMDPSPFRFDGHIEFVPLADDPVLPPYWLRARDAESRARWAVAAERAVVADMRTGQSLDADPDLLARAASLWFASGHSWASTRWLGGGDDPPYLPARAAHCFRRAQELADMVHDVDLARRSAELADLTGSPERPAAGLAVGWAEQAQQLVAQHVRERARPEILGTLDEEDLDSLHAQASSVGSPRCAAVSAEMARRSGRGTVLGEYLMAVARAEAEATVAGLGEPTW